MGVNGAYYASARDVNEQWPGLIEKAYAQWKGGYQKIGQGGFASDLFQALSGKEADWSDVKDFTADELFKKIKTSVSHHKPVAAGTFGEHDKRVSYTNTGVHGDHFYTVLGAVEEGGKKYIQLRNPWGSSEPGDGKLDGKDDGIFKLPVADFMKMYENIEFGG
jgi:cytolysin (calcineurin-like family phosphatase)